MKQLYGSIVLGADRDFGALALLEPQAPEFLNRAVALQR